jgi:uncharacterized protein YecT (DUF1311 family)
VSELKAIWSSVALVAIVHANASAAAPTRRGGLDHVLTELRVKWRASPRLIKQLDASQQSWDRSAVETCTRLVREAYDHGTIGPVKEDACLTQAASQRAALLTSTFQSTLRN